MNALISAICQAIAYGLMRGYLDALRDESTYDESRNEPSSDDIARTRRFADAVAGLRTATGTSVGENPSQNSGAGRRDDLGIKK